MRPSWLLSLLFLSACATPTAHFVATADDSVCEVDAVADALATADVVAFGELHQTPPVHRLHHELLASLHARRPNLVIAMEFFERDVQGVLLKYLSGMIDEPTFLAGSRPPRDYDRDYRPVIEFAKVNGLVVLAANAPRKLAAKVATEGASAVAGDPNVARETTAPEDDYWDAFVDAMKEHPGSTEKMMKNFYAAQCLKDDTMAESITDHLQERRKAGDRPLVVLICGNMHSNYGRGTVARIKSRMPDLDVRVLSAETVKDLSRGVYTSPKSIGEYVVLSPEVERPAQAMPAPKPAAPPVAAAPKAAAPKAEP
ncbi:MAG: ChaN family lipoprotein, partial [Planctomycetota bacterium]